MNCVASEDKKKGKKSSFFAIGTSARFKGRSFDNDYTNDTGAFHSRLIEATFCSFNYDKTKFPPLIISPVPRVSPSLFLLLVRARLINRRPRLYYARPAAPNTGIESRKCSPKWVGGKKPETAYAAKHSLRRMMIPHYSHQIWIKTSSISLPNGDKKPAK